MVIKHVGPVSCAKIAGILYGLMGLFFGGVVSLISLAGGFATAAFAADPSQRGPFPAIIGIGAVILFPAVYAIVGFIITLVGAWLYNITASLVGGIEVDLG